MGLAPIAEKPKITNMAKVKSSSKTQRTSYKVVGRTEDGVKILAPKTKPTHFTRGEMRSTISTVRREGSSGKFAERDKDAVSSKG